MNKLGQTRALLVARYPFFGFVAMHLTLGLAEVETACTDGKRIIFDPDFLKRLSDEEVLFVFCHEVMHACLSHPLRSTGICILLKKGNCI